MSIADDALSAAIAHLASKAAPAAVIALAAAIERAPWDDPAQARNALLAGLAPAQLRARAAALIAIWQNRPGGLSPIGLAASLRAAAATAQQLREAQRLELLWSGPQLPNVALHRTDYALEKVITAAGRQLLLVSFTVYLTPAIQSALDAALARGVRLTLVVERYESTGEPMTYDPVQSLGPITSRSTIYVWPLDQRTPDEAGRYGRMHVKCALADRRMLFLSSANLTGAAMNSNMELGVLIEGGDIPERVQSQFDQLIARGMLQRV